MEDKVEMSLKNYNELIMKKKDLENIYKSIEDYYKDEDGKYEKKKWGFCTSTGDVEMIKINKEDFLRALGYKSTTEIIIK